MQVRDKIKDEAYFKIYLEKELNRIIKFQNKLDNNEVKPDRVMPVKEAMLNIKY